MGNSPRRPTSLAWKASKALGSQLPARQFSHSHLVHWPTFQGRLLNSRQNPPAYVASSWSSQTGQNLFYGSDACLTLNSAGACTRILSILLSTHICGPRPIYAVPQDEHTRNRLSQDSEGTRARRAFKLTFTRSDQQLFWPPIRIWDDLASHGSACATRKLSTRNKRSPIMSTRKKLPANRLPNADEYQLKAALIVH
ncbi:hypothetical protein ACVIQY_002689 [Bradyrhizobium sp. USDA 3051]